MENLTYETRCKRCDEIIVNESINPVGTVSFANLISVLLRNPPLLPCPKCGIFTIQEVVSYTRPEFTKQDFELTQAQTDLIDKIQNGK
jgi:hypothetical protein